MKVIMLETVQGRDISGTLLPENIPSEVLQEGKSYEVDGSLAKWLFENNKAKTYKPSEVHYGAQAEPELRHDDEKYAEMSAESAAEEAVTDETGIEQPEGEPIMTTEETKSKRKRGRK